MGLRDTRSLLCTIVGSAPNKVTTNTDIASTADRVTDDITCLVPSVGLLLGCGG